MQEINMTVTEFRYITSAYHQQVKDTQSLGDILTQRLVSKALALSIES